MLHQQLINQATYWLIAIGLWSISLCAVAAPIANPDHGHYYELVVSDKELTYDEAAEASSKKTFQGVKGHLLTITDDAEATFLLNHQEDFSTGSSSWIGLRRDDQTGFFEFGYDYTWITGQALNLNTTSGYPELPAGIQIMWRHTEYTAHYKFAMRYQSYVLALENWRSDEKLASYIVEYDVKLSQTIFGMMFNTTKAKKGETVIVFATGGNSGNGVYYGSKTPTICKVDEQQNGQVFNLIGDGLCTVSANQAGNEFYTPAPEVTLDIVTAPYIAQTITFNKIENQVLEPPFNRGLTIKMVATASSGLPVTFESTTPICKNFPPSWLDNDVLTTNDVGTCTVVASQKGNENFKPATPVTQSFTIAKGEKGESSIFPLDALPKTIKKYNSIFPQFYFGRVGSTQPFTFSTKSKTCILEKAGDGDYNLRFLMTGTCTLTVNLAGDNDYNAAPEISADIKVLPLDKQTIIFESKLSDKTFGDPDFTIDAHGSGGWFWTVDFAIANPENSGCVVNGKTVKITGAGPCIINAFQKGYRVGSMGPQYPIFEYEKASAEQSFGIHKATQVINFSAPDAGIVGESAELKATKKGAPTPVSFSSTTRGVCTVGTDAMNSRGGFLNTVKFVGEGTCTVTAAAEGDINYKPKSETRDIKVKKPKEPQTITFNQLANKTFGDADFTIAATVRSGLPVSFSTGEGSSGCSITDHTVKITGAGICIIYANQAGNDQYLPARTKAQQFKIAQANQTIKFEPANTGTLGTVMNLSATGGASGNPVVFSSGSDICDVVLGDMNFIDNKWEESYVVRFWNGEGTCIVIASQAGDDRYNDAQVVANITVTKPKIPKRDQYIILGESLKSLNVDVKYGDQVKLSAMSTPSSLPVIFATETGSEGCSITGDTLKMTGVGTCILKMDQPGNDEFNPAPTDTLSIQVKKGGQVMNLSKFSPTAEVGAATILSATGGASGNPVKFYTQTPRVCTVENNVVTFVATGKCTLLINQAGNTFYDEAQWARYDNAWLKYLNITVTAATQPSVTPATPESRLITTPVSNSGRTLTDRTVTDTGSISGGTLCGHTTNSGSVFGVTICEGGQVTNCSNNTAGTMRNVTLNPNATLRCGKVAGEVVCKSPETSVLENLTVTANSHLADCKIGENVVFEENVVLTDTQNEGCVATVK